MARKHDLENLLNGQLAGLLTEAGVPAQAEVKQGNRRLDVLAEAVRQAPNSVADADKAASMLSDGLDTAVQGLGTPVRQALAKRLDLPRGKPTATSPPPSAGCWSSRWRCSSITASTSTCRCCVRPTIRATGRLGRQASIARRISRGRHMLPVSARSANDKACQKF